MHSRWRSSGQKKVFMCYQHGDNNIHISTSLQAGCAMVVSDPKCNGAQSCWNILFGFLIVRFTLDVKIVSVLGNSENMSKIDFLVLKSAGLIADVVSSDFYNESYCYHSSDLTSLSCFSIPHLFRRKSNTFRGLMYSCNRWVCLMSSW